MGAARAASDAPLIWLVATGLFMETLDVTIVNTALPAMAAAMGTTPLAMRSVVVAYGLTLAACIPVSGWAADRFGTRRIYLAAVALFGLGSAASALAEGPATLIAGRVVQGLGGGMLLPVGRLAVLRAFPGPRYLEAVSSVTMAALLGPLIGPPLGGWLVEVASWRWIFLVNLPVSLALAVATWRLMPTAPAAVRPPPLDRLGLVCLVALMVAGSLALEGPAVGARGALAPRLVALGALGTYLWHASRAAHPLLDLRLFRQRTFALGLAGSLTARLGAGSLPFLVPLFFQLVLGERPLAAGAHMLPLALASVVAKSWGGPLIGRLGYRRVLVANTLVLAIGMGIFALPQSGALPGQRALLLWILGSANSLQYTAINTLTLKDVPRADTAGANSLYSMVQMLAISLSVAAAGNLLTALGARTPSWAAAFAATFALMGGVTALSSAIFLALPAAPPRPAASP